MAAGNLGVTLCERGIRTFESFTRNTMDLNAAPAVLRLSHLPVVADPSHGTGKWYLVTPMASSSRSTRTWTRPSPMDPNR